MARRSGPAITRADVVDAAIRVLERGGIEALGTKRVAAELGIRTPSLYHHVRGNVLRAEGARVLLLNHPDGSTHARAANQFDPEELVLP